jgi:hypothetical protein
MGTENKHINDIAYEIVMDLDRFGPEAIRGNDPQTKTGMLNVVEDTLRSLLRKGKFQLPDR